ncbi:MAG TPA: hypothetical protein VF553_23075 [Pyrinomonadaceae bacterium]|jgi:hypothetical protein
MTDPKEKSKPVVPTRTPKKKTPGIFDNLRKIPQPHPVEEMLGLVPSEETTPSRPSTPSRGSTPSSYADTGKPFSDADQDSLPVSPQRDYSKVANSIIREAVPSGLFGGKSKQLYDYLYSLTRGAIVPRRTVRIPKEKLMKGAGIGAEVTLRSNLAKLTSVGLVIERIYAGTHGGNEYEVFLPGEPEQTLITPPTPSTPSRPSNPPQFLEPLPPLETTPSSTSLNSMDSEDYGKPKTFFKTNTEKTDDDEAFAEFAGALRSAFVEVTGRELSRAEAPRLMELADVLITEFKIAAARTSVTSAPSFLAEHLRRRLWKVDKKQTSTDAASSSADAKPARSTEALRDCPDCGGSGMYYPDGYEKGVARCKHENLKREENSGEAEV